MSAHGRATTAEPRRRFFAGNPPAGRVSSVGMASTGGKAAVARNRRRLLARAELVKAELRNEIRARGLVERQLAEQLGHSPTFLTDLFVPRQGRSPGLRVDTLFELLEVLGEQPSAFLARVEALWEEQEARRSQRQAAGKQARDRRNRHATADVSWLELPAKLPSGLSKRTVRGVLERAREVVAQAENRLGRKP